MEDGMMLGDERCERHAADDSGKPQPDFRVVQPELTQEGTTKFRNVGALWKNVSKKGTEFYTLRIGDLRLLVFPNGRKEPQVLI